MEFGINKIIRDEFGRASGILSIDKPAGMTSHDVVNRVRKALNMRKVGHAGALDPFATGVLVILVGKTTKMAQTLQEADKEYVAEILFGIKTDSADPEGEILEVTESHKPEDLEKVLQKFSPGYEQYVPVYSSVKVDGEKLRVLARKYDSHEIVERDDGKYVVFKKNDKVKEIKLPKHYCEFPFLELLTEQELDISNSDFYEANSEAIGDRTKFHTAKIKIECSKGTYIRTFAQDLGEELTHPAPAFLWNLRRTRVGQFNLENALTLEELSSL